MSDGTLTERLKKRAEYPGEGCDLMSKDRALLREVADALEMHVCSRVAYERDLQRQSDALKQAEKALREIAAETDLGRTFEGQASAGKVFAIAYNALVALAWREEGQAG